MNTLLIYPKNKQQEKLILNFAEENNIKNDVLNEKAEIYVPFKNFADDLLQALDKKYTKKKKA